MKALAAPFTVNTMPEATLKALAVHTGLGSILPADGGDCEGVLAQFAKAGIDIDVLASQLQDEGAKSIRQIVERADDRLEERCDPEDRSSRIDLVQILRQTGPTAGLLAPWHWLQQ